MGLSIGDLDINPRIAAAVKNAGFREGRMLLTLPSAELERLTGLSGSDITQLKDAISQAVVSHPPVSALQMWRTESDEETRSHRLTTGCATLDQALRGGLLVRGLTEVCGESGAGKTQLCLQLCLTVQLPTSHGGLDGGAVYISTEGAFPAKRLHQMSQRFVRRHSSLLRHRPTDHILLEHVAHLEGLKECLHRRLPVAMVRGRVKLVVLDSVAALLRCGDEDDNDQHQHYSLGGRARHLSSLATDLRRLALEEDVAVVCVNQVTANMCRAWKGPGERRQSIPALGLVWADHLTCRLLMSRPLPLPLPTPRTAAQRPSCEEARCGSDSGGGVMVTRRQLEVVFAPHLPPSVLPLVIDDCGVRHPDT